MKLEVYSNKDLQNFSSILSQCITKGITNVVLIKQTIDEQAASRVSVEVNSFTVRQAKKITNNKCPSCGARMHMNKILEGVRYNGCPKCYYSELV